MTTHKAVPAWLARLGVCFFAIVVPGAAAVAEPMPEPASSFEPEPGLRDYVSITTKITQPTEAAPASVSVITADDIAMAGYRSVGEALASVPGLFVSYDLENYNVAVRGLFGGARAGSRLLKVMIDGHPISFVQSGVYYLGPEFIPMSAVERIEIMRGPASALYGEGALVGAINVVTKRPPYEGGVTGGASVLANGSFGGERGGGGDGMGYLVSRNIFAMVAIGGDWEDRSGLTIPQDSPFYANHLNPDGTAVRSQNDVARPLSILAHLEMALAGGRLDLEFVAQRHDRVAEFYDLTVLSHDTRIALSLWTANLSYERPFSSGVSLLANVGVANGGPASGDHFDLGPGYTFTLRRDFGYVQVPASLEVRYNLPHDRGWMSVGTDGFVDFERFQTYDEIDRQTGTVTARPSPPSHTFGNFGAYGQLLIQATRWLSLSGGIRYDWNSVYGSAVSARMGAILPLTRTLNVKLLVGRAYKAPSPEQLYGVAMGNLDITGDEAIKPQYMFGTELVADYYPARWLKLSLSTYYNRYTDILAYIDRGNRLVPTPFNADAYGGELVVRAAKTFANGVAVETLSALSVQTLLTDQVDLGGFIDKYVPDNEAIPNYIVSTRLTLKMRPLWANLFVEYRWVSDRVPSQSNLRADGADLQHPIYMPPAYPALRQFHMLDLAVSSRPIHVGRSEVSALLKVANVLGAQYAEVGFNGVDVPSLPRTYWAQLRIDL